MPKFLYYPYYGPNRRSDRRLVEIRLEFNGQERQSLIDPTSVLRRMLQAAGIVVKGATFPHFGAPGEPLSRYAWLLAKTAVLLQTKAGHAVKHAEVLNPSTGLRRTALAEHEDPRTGMAAVKLVIDTLMQDQDSGTAPDSMTTFMTFARSRALSTETAAIISELRKRNIPFFQLDREPLEGNLDIGTRIRPNGQLAIGHGRQREMLDGTFCVSRLDPGLKALLNKPQQRRAILAQSGLPLADQANGQAVGHRFELLLINGKARTIPASTAGYGKALPAMHPSTLQAAMKLSRRIGLAPLSLSVCTDDISKPLAQTGGGVLDFDLAPDFGTLLAGQRGGAGLLESAVADLLDWLAPDPARLRVPLAAVTGTNGKTSTSRMLAHILGTAGFHPGLVCTDGTFVDGRKIQQGDASAFIGHAHVLTSKSIDAAVLESHHRGIAVRGFVFEHCDVALCLNVTADHLAEGQIETLEEMIEVKRALAERGRSVVLNADNPGCVSMLAHLEPERLCLYSSTRNARDLEKYQAAGYLLCTAESRAGEEWVVIHEAGRAEEIVPVSEMPCSFDGTARFLLENAQAAIAAAYLLGAPVTQIAAAMKTFEMSFDTTPGRLGVYRNLPFTAIMDYAHNPDGIARLAEFTDAFPVAGKRLMLLAGTGSRSDEMIAKTVRTAAGHYDHFVCRSYPNLRGRQRGEVPIIVRAALLDAGVPESSISQFDDPAEAVTAILEMAQADDLVVLQLNSDEFAPVHQKLQALGARQEKNHI